MIFFNDTKVYYTCFNFLISDYGYSVIYQNIENGIHYSEIVLENPYRPKLKIEIERGYLDLYVYINSEYWPLCLLYKFLHHNKIVKRKFGNSKVIKDYFEKTTRLYLDDVFENLSNLNKKKLDVFYKEFPDFCFLWS